MDIRPEDPGAFTRGMMPAHKVAYMERVSGTPKDPWNLVCRGCDLKSLERPPEGYALKTSSANRLRSRFG